MGQVEIREGIWFPETYLFGRMNMAIKMLALDLDDTLLDSTQRISPQCLQVIRRARETGVLVTVATGRMFRSAAPYARELELDIPMIAYQGALVKTLLSDEVFYYKTIHRDLAGEILELLQLRGVVHHMYCNDYLYMMEVPELARQYLEIARIEPIITHDFEGVLRQHEATEIMVVAAQEELLLETEAEIRSRFGSQLHITSYRNRFLEIMHRDATKGKALEVLSRHYGIERREVMAIGDSLNDLSMVEWAGIGVAMGNAEPEVKEAADFVTLSNDEEGVAEAIRRFVLQDLS